MPFIIKYFIQGKEIELERVPGEVAHEQLSKTGHAGMKRNGADVASVMLDDETRRELFVVRLHAP